MTKDQDPGSSKQINILFAYSAAFALALLLLPSDRGSASAAA